MANTIIAYQEIRFDVRDPQITDVFVLIENVSRDGFPVGGWYHKSFPARMSTMDILKEWAEGREDPIMWSHRAPDLKTRADKANHVVEVFAGIREKSLAERDAEIERLRECLRQIKGVVCGEALPNWENTPATGRSRARIADFCDEGIDRGGH